MIYIIVIETKFKTENSIKIYFIKKTINQIRFIFLSKGKCAHLNRVPKVPFRFFDKFKNEIQNSILRFCFCFNKEDEIQITDYHFHV